MVSQVEEVGRYSLHPRKEREELSVVPYPLIFDFLPDLHSVLCVSTSMRKWAVEEVIFNKCKKIKSFISLLIQNLDRESYHEQRKALEVISEEVNFKGIYCFSAIKMRILHVKEQLINVIKTLPENVIKYNLKMRITPPKFLESVFDSSFIEIYFERAWGLQIVRQKEDELLAMSKALIRIGDFERAAKVALVIEDQALREKALENVVEIVVRSRGDCSVISEVIQAIPEELIEKARRKGLLYGTFLSLLEEGKIEETLQEAQKEDQWALCSQAFAEMGNAYQALEAAHKVIDEREREKVLGSIAKLLAQIGDFNQAMRVAFMIGNENDFEWALYTISKAMIQSSAIYSLEVNTRLMLIRDRLIRSCMQWEVF